MIRAQKVARDPYVRTAADYPPRPGQCSRDVYESSPGPSIPLNQELGGPDPEYTTKPKDPGVFLCLNADLGDYPDGLVRHLGYPGCLGYAGKCAGNMDGGRVRIMRTGRVFLNVEGLTANSRGKAVYSQGPNGPYSVSPTDGAFKIGVVRFVEPGMKRASVAIQAHDHKGRPDLAIDNDRW
jgi:hypothetical protein